MTTAARVYLFACALGCAAYLAVGGSDLLYNAFGISSAVAVAVGIRRNRPRRRGAWILVCAGIATLSAGDLWYFQVTAVPSFPSVADVLYLAGGLVWAGALIGLVGFERIRRNVTAMADTVVFSLALGLLLWAAFYAHAFGNGAWMAELLRAVFPLGTLLLLTILIRVLLEPGQRTASFFLAGASVLLLVYSDAWYVLPALTRHYVPGTWRDLGWLGSYACMGAAALDPSMRVFVRHREGVLPLRRVVLLGGALVLVAVAAFVQYALDGSITVFAFAGVGGAMSLFVTYRMASLVRAVDAAMRAAQESERRFRMVFERSPIGISVGRDGIMSETNPALQRMLGYTGEELAGMHYTDVTHPDDHDLAEQLQLDAGMRDSFVLDKRYTAKDGRVVDTHVHVALDLEDGLGISLLEDVTQRRELEEQLRQSQKMEAVGKLAGGVAHDFNNLMTAVLGYSDLLLQRLAPTDVNREKIVAIRDAAVRASDLTRQLLAFGRRQMLQTVDVDLRDVVRRMEGLLRRVIGEDVRLVTSFGAEPVVVRADETQLEQVIVNLAVNARDAMPNGGTLTIGVVGVGDAAVLSVADTGTGMDEATRARIFEPFFTTKPMGEGSGLGLSTVHGIVGQSGGSIDVASALGAGTIFTVRLPLRPPAALPEAAALAILLD